VTAGRKSDIRKYISKVSRPHTGKEFSDIAVLTRIHVQWCACTRCDHFYVSLALSEMTVHLCPGSAWDWKEKVAKCHRTDSVTVRSETESTNPQNTSAKYQHNIPAKNTWISISSMISEKPHTKTYVLAATFAMLLLLLLIAHIISLLWTVEPGKKETKRNLVECYGVAGLSETEYSECYSHTTDWMTLYHLT